MKISSVKLIKGFPRHALLKKSLITGYKGFARPHIDYGVIICIQFSNEAFRKNLESVQCKPTLPVTGATQGTLRKKVLIILGLESLQPAKPFRGLCFMVKIIRKQALEYLNILISKSTQNSNLRNNYILRYNCRTECFRSSLFFPLENNILTSSVHMEWNYLPAKVLV